jgi:hypothetical protein
MDIKTSSAEQNEAGCRPETVDLTTHGLGNVEVVIRTKVAVECFNCGEPADERHSYLLPNARSNPQSSAFGGDDVSWCSDAELFTCKSCRDAEWRGREPEKEGYRWCSTFQIGRRFAHMFLCWTERKATLSPSVVSALGLPAPRFQSTSCSECGRDFGPGFHGYSHCSSHRGLTPQVGTPASGTTADEAQHKTEGK